MGSCDSKEVVVGGSAKGSKNTTQIQQNKKKASSENECEKETQALDPKFKDMPEWEGDRFRGEGIKRMKGYKCDMIIDLLNQLREEFWATKTNTKLVWRHLKTACYMDDGIFYLIIVRALQVVKQLELKLVDNCLNHLVDAKGHHYHIPNFCINDPYFEKGIRDDQNPIFDAIKIYITELYGNTKTLMEVSQNITGWELKVIYFQKMNLDITKYKCRLLFGGGEIQDKTKLYQHDIKENYQVQIIKNLIES